MLHIIYTPLTSLSAYGSDLPTHAQSVRVDECEQFIVAAYNNMLDLKDRNPTLARVSTRVFSIEVVHALVVMALRSDPVINPDLIMVSVYDFDHENKDLVAVFYEVPLSYLFSHNVPTFRWERRSKAARAERATRRLQEKLNLLRDTSSDRPI